jgi:hypothetical protein
VLLARGGATRQQIMQSALTLVMINDNNNNNNVRAERSVALIASRHIRWQPGLLQVSAGGLVAAPLQWPPAAWQQGEPDAA